MRDQSFHCKTLGACDVRSSDCDVREDDVTYLPDDADDADAHDDPLPDVDEDGPLETGAVELEVGPRGDGSDPLALVRVVPVVARFSVGERTGVKLIFTSQQFVLQLEEWLPHCC